MRIEQVMSKEITSSVKFYVTFSQINKCKISNDILEKFIEYFTKKCKASSSMFLLLMGAP